MLPHSLAQAISVCVALTVLLVAGVHPVEAEEPYRQELTAADIQTLTSGGKLSDSDPYYCEKKRDLCLFAFCGSTDRDSTVDGCWTHCTEIAFARCKNLKN